MTDESNIPLPEQIETAPVPKPRHSTKKAAKKTANVSHDSRAKRTTTDAPAPLEAYDQEPVHSAGTVDEASGISYNESFQDSILNEVTQPETVGGESQNAKRKRRRKRGKGNSQGTESETSDPGEVQQVKPPHQSVTPPNRPRIDPELVSKRAWKIYLSEVSEEGVALVSDQDAKELTRRCFRLAEIFLEEQMRRR